MREEGGNKHYKARLVVKGFAQKKGIDFDEIFSLVVKVTSIRTILSLVVVEDFASWTVGCKNNLSPWGFGGRDLYATATGVWGQREGEFSLQVEEELVWPEASSKTVVFKIS